MEKPVIIAVSGWKRSGKDTVAEYLIKTYGAKRLAFADPLKNNVARDYNIDRASIDDPALKEAPLLNMPVSPRDAFSKNLSEFMFKEFRSAEGEIPESFGYGTGEFAGSIPYPAPLRGFHIEKLYWTRRALCILEGSTKRTAHPDYWVDQASKGAVGNQMFVISDLRYKNEADTLKKSGVEVLTVRINRFETSPSNDPSERDLDDYNFDVVISNKATLEDLYAAVENTLLEKGVVTKERSQAY